jgi:hypothetical protein
VLRLAGTVEPLRAPVIEADVHPRAGGDGVNRNVDRALSRRSRRSGGADPRLALVTAQTAPRLGLLVTPFQGCSDLLMRVLPVVGFAVAIGSFALADEFDETVATVAAEPGITCTIQALSTALNRLDVGCGRCQYLLEWP